MIDGNYVVFTRKDDCEIYWTGEIGKHGRPEFTAFIEIARKFDTARHAYDVAGQFRRLDDWRVGRRDDLAQAAA